MPWAETSRGDADQVQEYTSSGVSRVIDRTVRFVAASVFVALCLVAHQALSNWTRQPSRQQLLWEAGLPPSGDTRHSAEAGAPASPATNDNDALTPMDPRCPPGSIVRELYGSTCWTRVLPEYHFACPSKDDSKLSLHYWNANIVGSYAIHEYRFSVCFDPETELITKVRHDDALTHPGPMSTSGGYTDLELFGNQEGGVGHNHIASRRTIWSDIGKRGHGILRDTQRTYQVIYYPTENGSDYDFEWCNPFCNTYPGEDTPTPTLTITPSPTPTSYLPSPTWTPTPASTPVTPTLTPIPGRTATLAPG
jgi:hypothetical protein